MLIFELISQYESICRMAMCECSAKLNKICASRTQIACFFADAQPNLPKSFRTNIIEILILIMAIPRKINFLQLGRHGKHGEQCYRQAFEREFDWLQFIMNLAANRFQHSYRRLASTR